MTSVIVPVRNGAVIAKTTVRSMLQCQSTNEWIWVDDGSTDATASVVTSAILETEQAQLLQLHPNQGRSAARNAGVAASRGDVLVFFDIDVEPSPGSVYALTEAALADGAVAAVGRLAPVLDDPTDPYQEYLATFDRGPAADTRPGDVLDWRYFLSGVCAIRRDALEHVGGFRTDIAYGEDVDLGCRLAKLAPDGLRLANTTVALHDVGTLEQALGRADAFGRSVPLLDAECRARVLGRMGSVPGASIVARIAAHILQVGVEGLPAGPTRRRAVRYLLATRILSAARRA